MNALKEVKASADRGNEMRQKIEGLEADKGRNDNLIKEQAEDLERLK